MGRGAPNKKGLDYFPKMVDFYEDDRIFDLLDRYGPLGVTVYDCILCIVYKHGYYAEIPLDKLSRMITKMIGNKWVKSSKVVVQVVHFCSEIGLIDDALMTKNIITSVGIQRRFYKIAVKLMKRQLYDDQYWLLKNEETGEPLLNAPKNRNISETTGIISEENRNTSELSPIKEKESKDIYNIAASPGRYFEDSSLNDAFLLFLRVRANNGDKLLPEQISLLREEVLSLSNNTDEQVAIVKKAAMSNWRSFYPTKKQRTRKGEEPQAKNRFNNFPQRDNADVIKQLEAMGGKNHDTESGNV